ncbi:V-type ATP synthase subunit I [Claveliimonas sp.]|uniref:V-type ATP synthase subunit I n=1 Tax=Claveliimonas sp. TaxID=3076672 RepID=UPI00307BB0F9
MAVLQMQRVSICALKKDRKSILEKLQSMGILEISQVADEDDAFSRMDTMNARVSFEKKANIADQALDVLDGYAPESKSMFASLEGKKLIGSSRFQSAVADKEKIMDTAADLIQTSKVIAEKKAAILKLENQIESLTPYLSLEVPMNYSGTKKVAMFIGTMAAETQLQDVYSTLAEQLPEVEAVDIQIISSDQDAVYLAVLCMREDASKVEEVLRSAGFARPAQLSEEVPSVKTQELKESIQQLNNEIKEQEDKIKSCAEERERLRYISDYFRMRAEKYEVLGTLPQSQRTFVISGYTAKKFVPALEKAIGANYDCVMDVEEVGEEEEVPTILQNNSFSRSWEGIVESYGLPKRGEFDPTTIMSFFYVFFFGMMLSDAAYGAILAIACFVLLKKFPRMSPGMYQSIKLFMFCGISTVIWGILFGGYFGNIVDVVSAKFFGTTITPAALWFIPLNDPMKLLVYSMLFGVIHLFVGLGIKGYMCIKNRQFMDFFCDVVLWFCLVVGLILMLLPSSLFASIAQTEIVFPDVVNLMAKVLAIFGAVGIVLMSGRGTKNPGIRLALGAYDLYNITGWLSDVLSYSRLLALGLATGVIASVINQMGSMVPNNIFGIIAFIVIFIVGHALNLAINLLGAYVHTNRLQFVEFFGKFYEGGGKPFEPFCADTKYVDIKEET